MAASVPILLRDPAALSAAGAPCRFALLATCLLGAALWGAAMGSHAGGGHLWISALKMPLFLLATLALCFPLMHVTLLVSGIRVSAGETLRVALAGLCTLALCLGALAPVVGLFCATAPQHSMASYLNLYVLCLVCGAVAGVAGLRALTHGMTALAGRRVIAPLLAWALIYQFTGAQMAWILRPWIGGADYSLEHGLSGNFYSGVWSVLQRWLTHTGVL
jgi:hypothetical protein